MVTSNICHFLAFTKLCFNVLPLYNKFRTVASILVIAEIAMPVLAVLGLRELFKEPDGWRKHKVALMASFGLCAAICLLTALAPGIFGHFSAEEHEQLVASGQIQQYPSVDAAIAAVRGALHGAASSSSSLASA